METTVIPRPVFTHLSIYLLSTLYVLIILFFSVPEIMQKSLKPNRDSSILPVCQNTLSTHSPLFILPISFLVYI